MTHTKTNLEEYENPVLYDFENDDYIDDVYFILEWVREAPKGTIIDLACGTGRATIPLAKHGFDVIGVDIHSGMLNRAKEKAGKLSIKWVEQDCTNLNVGIKSPVIYMVGNAFQHFLTNQEQDQLLTSVYRHLLPGGVFIFDTRYPTEDLHMQSIIGEHWNQYIDPETGQKIEVGTYSEYDSVEQIEKATTIRKSPDGKQNKTEIRLRYTYPKEMERLAYSNGFNILHLFGDWYKRPLSNNRESMVCILQKHG